MSERMLRLLVWQSHFFMNIHNLSLISYIFMNLCDLSVKIKLWRCIPEFGPLDFRTRFQIIRIGVKISIWNEFIIEPFLFILPVIYSVSHISHVILCSSQRTRAQGKPRLTYPKLLSQDTGLDPQELLNVMQDRTLWRKLIMASDRGRRKKKIKP